MSTIPETIRVLRLIVALDGLLVFDSGGAEPLYSYSFDEIGQAFDFLRVATRHDKDLALLEHARRSGEKVELARVIPFKGVRQ